MDAIDHYLRSGKGAITAIDMHTTGEPTRIIISGFPDLSGSLLEQRAQAEAEHDHIRKRVMLEPAGHADMYGAILRPKTELTETGKAHMGVLFTTNEGYSTMCGHATIALGRFLVDTHDLNVFPRRNEIAYDEQNKTATVNLHAPCGLVKITVPITGQQVRSDPSRAVSFICVPSFATGKDINIHIPENDRWPEIKNRGDVAVSFCYGGAFTCLVSCQELGFGETGLRSPVNLRAMSVATKKLKDIINGDPVYRKYLTHPEQKELSSLYTTIVVDKDLGKAIGGSLGAETGLCYFADAQIDRSPTGSAVAARVAYAAAIGERRLDQSWTYHSLVSNAVDGQGGFVGTIVGDVEELYDKTSMLGTPVSVRVEGKAYYVGSHNFIAEHQDPYGDGGFLFHSL